MLSRTSATSEKSVEPKGRPPRTLDTSEKAGQRSFLSRRGLLGATLGLGLAGGLGTVGPVAPTPAHADGRVSTERRRWARDTWRSLAAMADPRTGLVADNIDADLTTRSGYTSPTNIGGYLWSALVAREWRIIGADECRHRIARTLATLERMERHRPSGMYFNWYDEATGEVLTTWPDSGEVVTPFVSSVDSAWLGAALWVVAHADRANRRAARRLFDAMRWDMFFDPDFGTAGGMHGGFCLVQPPGRTDGTWGNHIGVGDDVWYTNHHYDTAVSETRMTTYLGIMTAQVPASAYFGTWRTFPPDWDWPEMAPVGQHRTYLGVSVFEGAHQYRGMRIVPGWGGSMFEELMPDIFVPEAKWGPRSWGRNHPLHVRAQREHGMVEADYGYWGFSPCSNPLGGYREYGVDALGLNPDGYFSDVEQTDYDAVTNPAPDFGEGVVTPHAGFLAMMHDAEAAQDNLQRIERVLGCYGRGGFFDAVATRTRRTARRYLSLDQAMVMGALGNVELGDRVRDWFATREVAATLRPLLAMEEFGADA